MNINGNKFVSMFMNKQDGIDEQNYPNGLK